MDLSVCPACLRHMRVTEEACPFCSARVLRRGLPAGAVLLVAAVSLAACGGGGGTRGELPVARTTSGPGDEAPPAPAADPADPGDPRLAAAYGAPPPLPATAPDGPPAVVAKEPVDPPRAPGDDPRRVPAYGAPRPPAPDRIPLGKPGVSGRAIMSTPMVTGSLASHPSRERTLGSIRTAMHRCYQAALAQDPTSRGKVKFRVVVGASGTVTQVISSEVTFLGPDALRCMAEQLGAVRTDPGAPSTIAFDLACVPD